MRFYHGSPYGGLTSFAGVMPPLFLTQDENVALTYATGTIPGAQRDPGVSAKSPTIYTLEYDPNRAFDLRLPQHRALYEQLRAKKLQGLANDDEAFFDFPKTTSLGFIGQRGLPFYGKERGILSLLQENGQPFTAIWVDESTQGISLAVFDPGSVQIVGQRKLSARRITMANEPQYCVVDTGQTGPDARPLVISRHSSEMEARLKLNTMGNPPGLDVQINSGPPNPMFVANLQDRIARRLIREGIPAVKQAGSWHTDLDELDEGSEIEYRRSVMAFGPNGDIKITCMVADDMDMQIEGLQTHAEIGMYEGMLFPYKEPRTATFHMGKVRFPIDMIFVGSDNRVTKIVENIEPGSPGRWGMGRVSAVIETNGGFCASHGIEVGTPVKELSEKTAQELFPSHPRPDINRKMVPVNTDPNRFRDRDLVDQQVVNQPMSPHHEEQWGYGPVNIDPDDENIVPTRPAP